MRKREDLLQELLGIAVNSYASYVLKAAAMPCYDEADKKLLALFRDVAQREQSYTERAYDTLFAAGLRPSPHAAALHFAQLNFCRPFQVATRWATEARREAEACKRLLSELKSSSVGASPQAIRLCEDMVILKEESGRRVETKLHELRPTVSAAAPANVTSTAASAGAPPRPAATMPPPPGGAAMPKPPGAAMPKPPGAPAAMPAAPGAPTMPKPPGATMPKPPGAPVMPKPPMMPPPPK